MPITKTEEFSSREKRLSTWAKTLAHPARVAILRILAKRNACICGEIVDALPLAQATVSQHLKALKDAGLIVGKLEGPSSCYCINKEAVESLAADMNELFDELKIGCTTTSCTQRRNGHRKK